MKQMWSIQVVSHPALGARIYSKFLTNEQWDLHSDNLLVAITDDSILSKVEEDEIRSPSARKQVGDTIIYVSRYMLGGAGPLVICDFGQARIGNKHLEKQ